MKPPVIGPGSRVQDVRRNRSASRTSGGSFALHLQTDSKDEPAAVTAPTELMGLDAILALQEAGGDDTKGRQQAAQQHGESILDRLEQLRANLLLGRVSPGQLAALTEQLRARPSLTGDTRLDAILGEIELRAEVELAKLQESRRASTD